MKDVIIARFTFLPTADGFYLLTGDQMLIMSNPHLDLQTRANSFIECFPLSYFTKVVKF